VSKDVLDLFHPAIRRWFGESFAEPTPPQAGGWPAIASGENTLIHAPTGSGKTLAAFLFAIHELVDRTPRIDTAGPAAGVHTLYVSPLKALANDIERNLEGPLAGIRSCAAQLGLELPEITVGLRTGDTPPSARRRMVSHPPDLLITTPESLHLLLTSPRAREILRAVEYVIVDEIHSLVPTKRGSFLALLLERLEALCGRSPVRIGLSGTQRPLDLVARFLGGCAADGTARPVKVVDAGMRKRLDLRVVVPVEDMTALPKTDDTGPTIWPSVHEALLDLVSEHTSTLVFANNRRLVEKIAAEMNRLAGHDLVRAHHGSVSKVARLEIESELKAGRLPALVATSSLELGIDVGAIDLVCQVETPISVASALQRVGRAGHVYRQTSKGRLIPKTRDDLLRMAAVVRDMRRGEISEVRCPENALDVLAQQVVAMVAVEAWSADALFASVRRAYPYRELSREAFEGVLELVSGRYRSPTLSALRARVAWDRARDCLEALPGSRQAVVLNGGTIPDTGQYAMVLEDGKTKLGELDEEFVFERRLGQTILLGTHRWRIVEIGADRVRVAPSETTEAVMPFWKGDGLGHDAAFGRRFGEFIRDCEARLQTEDVQPWLAELCALDEAASRNLATYLRAQLDRGGVLPTDRTILIDVFRNEVEDPRIAIVTPFGRVFHLAMLLALQGTLREESGSRLNAVFSNVGILIDPGRRPVDELIAALRSLTEGNVRERILLELEQTPYFALHFRRNAARALLLPRAKPGRRTPLWLQRLRSHELLDYAKGHRGFPIIAETYREIVEDVLPLDEVRRFLRDVESGTARYVVRRERHPAPFTAALTLEFAGGFLYEDDVPAPASRGARLDRAGIAELLREEGTSLELDPDALRRLDERLQGLGAFERARDGAELVELLRRVGDLTVGEIEARCEEAARDALAELIADERIVAVPTTFEGTEPRYTAAEDVDRYARWSDEDVRWAVLRFASNRATATRNEVSKRYPGPATNGAIEELLEAGALVEVQIAEGMRVLAAPEVVAGARRMTLSARRKRFQPVGASALSRMVLARQQMTVPVRGEDGLRQVLTQLAGVSLGLETWDACLRARVEGYRRDGLDRLVRDGIVCWRGRGGADGARAVGFAPHDMASVLGDGSPAEAEEGSERAIVEALRTHGASYLDQLARALDMAPSSVADTLWRLTWAGIVTNDALDPASGPRGERESARRGSGWGGRWSLWEASTRGGPAEEERTRIALEVLLDRYGILTREIVGRERVGVSWREAYPILSRMEWRGEVDRGLFVESLGGLQFARIGVAALLADASEEGSADGTMILVPSEDPANLWGDVLPIDRLDGERYVLRRHSGNHLVLADGRPVLAIENRGERLVPLVELDGARRAGALGLLRELVRGPGRRPAIRVRTWDGAPIGGTPAGEDLEGLGFMREDPWLILYRSYD